MKKSNLITCFAISLAIGGATAAGFVSQSAQGSDAISAGISMPAVNETHMLYLDTSSYTGWEEAGAIFAIYNPETSSFVTDVNDNYFMTADNSINHMWIFEVNGEELPSKVSFTRHNPNTTTPEHSGDYFWGETYDLTFGSTYNGLEVTGWSNNKGSYNPYFYDKNTGPSTYIVGDFNEWAEIDDYKMTYNFSDEQYEITNVNLPLDNSFKLKTTIDNRYRKITTSPKYFGFSDLQNDAGQAKSVNQLVEGDENNNIKVNVPGDYSFYLTTKGELANKVWSPAIDETYIVQVNGENYTLIQNPQETSEFITAEEISIKSGDAIKLLVNGTEVTPVIREVGNNNLYLNEDNAIVANYTVSGKINIRSYSTNPRYDIFGGGITANGIGMLIESGSLPSEKQYFKLIENPSKEREWMITGHTFTPNDKIKFVSTINVGQPTEFSVLTIDDGGAKSVFETSTSDNCIKFIGDTSGKYNLYVKLPDGGQNSVYVETADETLLAAIEYSDAFETAFIGICQNPSDPSFESNFKQAWSTQSANYKSLDENVRTVLTNASSSSANPELVRFAERYDHQFRKYGSLFSLENFAGRNVTPNAPINVFNQNLIIYILTGAGVIALSTLAIILIKKKKTK